MRQQFNRKLVPSLQKLLGVLRSSNAGWSTSENDSSGRQRGALRQEADELGNTEYEVAIYIVFSFRRVLIYWKGAHVNGQSCRT